MTHPPTEVTPTLLRNRTGAIAMLVGAAALGAYSVLAPSVAADVLFVAIGVASATAVFVGLRRRRPIVAGAWFAIGLALALLTGANVLVAAAGSLPALRPLADVLYLAAYFPFFIAAIRFGRGVDGADRTIFLDSGIIGLAALPLAWEFLVEPRVPAAALGSGAAMALAVPVVAVVLVSLAAPLLYVRSSRSTSAVLLVVGLALVSAGDTQYAIQTIDVASTAGIPTLAWLAGYMSIGASALVPTAQSLGAARDPNPGRRDAGRLAVLGAAVLVLPLLTMHEALADADPELMAFALLALVGAGLLVLRVARTLGQLATLDQRFRSFMSNDRFIALIKDPAGRYLYMNPSADAVSRDPDVDWYGRTDVELHPPDVAAARTAADAAVRRDGTRRVGTWTQAGRIWHTERFALPGRSGDIGLLGVDITDRVRAEEAVRFQARLLHGVRDAVVVLDLDRRFTYWNRGATEIFGCPAEEMLGEPLDRLVAPGAEAGIAASWAALDQGGVNSCEWNGVRRDGTALWLDGQVSGITDDSGTLTGYLCVARDVTARKDAELELARRSAAIDNATDAVLVTDEGGRIVYVNPGFEVLMGFSAEQTVGRRPSDMPGGDAFARALGEAEASAAGWRGDIVTWRKDGSDLISETSISPIHVNGGTAAGFVVIARDVTRERTAGRIADRRTRERALIAETLGSLRAGVAPEQTSRAICEQLVKVPEVAIASLLTFAGDGIATVLAQADRSGGGTSGVTLPAGRSGYLWERAVAGPWVEHWVPEATHPYAQYFDELDVMAHAYAPIMVGAEPIGLLIIGSDQVDAIDRMAERLPALLEFAAITATLLGGAVAERRAAAELEAKMRAVIDDGAFYPVFQPIVDLSTGEVRGYEGLTRFLDGTAPDVRFEQAAQLGAGLALESACLEAIFDAADHLPQGPWLNVNTSPELVMAGGLEKLLPSGTREVVLEITEHQAISDYASFRAAVEPIRNRVKIAIDDAGAGFASLRHIVELSPSMVKLDRSLIAGIDRDPAREAVVAGMVRFAQAAGLALLAEGIETREELAMLRQLGVQLGQGYLLGRPGTLSQAAFEALTFDAAGSVAARRARPAPGRPGSRPPAARRPAYLRAVPSLAPLGAGDVPGAGPRGVLN